MKQQTSDTAAHLIALEEAALRRWCKGDPSGFLEISAADVVYFDPFLPLRLNGLEALTDYYESIRGKVSAERFELIDPCVQQIGNAAVLTFNFRSFTANGIAFHWNCTEVFRCDAQEWKLIQTHWSFNNAGRVD